LKLADTAQAYGNEEEAGRAVRESGLARKDMYITTKYSGYDGLDIETSIHNSLKNVRPLPLPPITLGISYEIFIKLPFNAVQLGVEYVDLYLIHHPRLAQPDIPTAWAEMEAIKRAGLAK
jgi:diketogulonate reductase-like aldo/keto reductase